MTKVDLGMLFMQRIKVWDLSFKVNAINMFHGITIVDDATTLFNGNC
jgi:hypothetical protein